MNIKENLKMKKEVDTKILFHIFNSKKDSYYSGERICEILEDTINLSIITKKNFSENFTQTNLWSIKWENIKRIFLDVVSEFATAGGGTGISQGMRYSLSIIFDYSEGRQELVTYDFSSSKLLLQIASKNNVEVIDKQDILSVSDENTTIIQKKYDSLYL